MGGNADKILLLNSINILLNFKSSAMRVKRYELKWSFVGKKSIGGAIAPN
jgi:hypothetical protein